ncbi:hypothetical protein J7E68_06455 [Microbacterium sp. ISL-103]|uniref:hypothetical protein n=1 Tax=Microbacterium sp. ISL-103 TaxID=2819156 RepID=UPI001BE8B53A|nr:hypothetical protein [Microbacterium sp. ISL-103]MBT2474227.1 hypothetical protein [Microbacterium sp. ISL-103]
MQIRSYRGQAPKHAKEFSYLSERIRITAPFHLDFTVDDGVELGLSLDLDRTLGRIVCRHFSMSQIMQGKEITGTEIRDVAIATLIRYGGDDMIKVRGTDGRWLPLSGAGRAFAPAEGRERAEVVADAAVIYAVSALTERAPLKLVADRLGVSQSTATRLVSSARLDGLLNDG